MRKCINCGRFTNLMFCEYCNKDIQNTINSTNTNYFDYKYDYQKIYKCENDIYVKSQGERTISDFLYANNIPFEYETKCKYGEYNIETHEITARYIVPDFFIKGPVFYKGTKLENIYIEFWGRNDRTYLETKEYRISIYEAHKATLINIYPEDIYDYKKSLEYKLTNFENNKINY